MTSARELASVEQPEAGSSILAAALAYAARGWSVIPCKGKKPLLSSWTEYQSRCATEDEIRAWWTRWPDANVALITGAVSGLVVVATFASGNEFKAKIPSNK